MKQDLPFPKQKETKKLSRRELLAGAVVGAGTVVANSVGAEDAHSVPDATKLQGRPPAELGQRSRFEKPERAAVLNIVSFTPLQDLHGTITPSDLHFERHHGGIPELSQLRHELLIHGMVERPLKFTVADLKRLPSVTRTCFIECSGNYFTRLGERSTPQFLCGLTSQSEWTGVSLGTLLREAGVRRGASWLLAEGGDAAVLSRSVPLAKALDDALIVYAQNGEAIRPAQGYPMRLLLPGWEGNTNVKWLRRIELTDAASMSREETSKYTEPMLNGNIRQFSFELDARSVITSPAHPMQLEPGWHEIRGLAWSGRGKIRGVEVSTDGGKSWRAAKLQKPVLAKAHTRFTLPWYWNGASTELQSRATDETGYLQPTMKQLLAVKGPGAGPYHFNPVIGWRVQSDGEVLFSET